MTVDIHERIHWEMKSTPTYGKTTPKKFNSQFFDLGLADVEIADNRVRIIHGL